MYDYIKGIPTYLFSVEPPSAADLPPPPPPLTHTLHTAHLK